MSRLGFLARKAGPDEKPNEPAATSDNPLELDEELFSALGAQLGGENEALRNLLLDANNKINELDTIKVAVGKLVEPVGKALRNFEAEKTEKVGLQSVLNNTRTAYGKLRNEVGDIEKRFAAADRECKALRQDLATAQNQLRTLEAAKAEISTDIAARRGATRSPIWKRVSRSRPANASPCARRTAASTNGWSSPTSARSRLNPISAPRVSAC